jgi:Ribonuclease G/E
VTVDFAPFPKADRHRVDQALKAAFRAERDETVLAGWTPLGHFEMQRKRSRLPLSECLP